MDTLTITRLLLFFLMMGRVCSSADEGKYNI